MDKVGGTIPEFSSENMVALVAQLGEPHTEDNTLGHMKAPCPVYGQGTITIFNSNTGKIPFHFTHNQYPPNNKLMN